MKTYFTLAGVAGLSEQLAKAGQLSTIAVEAAESGEGVLATIAGMIIEAPEYPGPSFLDRPRSPGNKAPKAEQEAYAAELSAYLLSQDHIRQYYLQGDAATARKRYMAEKAFCEEEYSKKKLELLAADPESKLNKLRAEAEAAERLLSPFISKLKAKLKAEAGEEAPQEKKIEVKTPEAKDARDLYNLIKREEGRKEARWSGAQFDMLYSMLESLKKDPTAKHFLNKLTK